MTAAPAEVFEEHRRRLFGIAYGMLGLVDEAEDVVQDAWLRWQAAAGDTVRNPAAWLTTVTTRLAIDRLRSARHRRETYVGPWLPEPVATGAGADPAGAVVEAEQLSLALLFALERLNPVERAVLLLRDVFDYDYAELAPIVDRSVANCRQIAARARDRVGDPHRSGAVAVADERALLDRLLLAVASGDVATLEALLAADVTFWSDGGAQVHAARHPILGRDRVIRFVVNLGTRIEPDDELEIVECNGQVMVAVRRSGLVDTLLGVDSVDGVVTTIRALRNPEKLARLTARGR